MDDTPTTPNTTTLAGALPEQLVTAIHEHLSHRHADGATLLSMATSSAVGHDCLRVAYATQALIFALGDAQEHGGVICTDEIWNAAAHQCVIFAFA